MDKTRAKIAKEYGISRKTLYNWLKKEGIQFRYRTLGAEEMELIYERFGRPKAA